MNNPLPGSRRPSVCLGSAFPMAILLWTLFFILPRSGEQWALPAERITYVHSSGGQEIDNIQLTACFPSIVPRASLHGGTRTAGSTLPHGSGAARVFPPTSVTNCNHHERGRAGSVCLPGRPSRFGTPPPSLPRGAAPVLLFSFDDPSVRSHHAVPQALARLAGP
ncbi:MAG: hypothetical protein H6568_10820 [Lewinellaceae bacterium]|nr:hypothetical protein [Lewinellaceae bacterium]